MANRQMESYLTSLVNREIQIESIMRFHYTFIRIAKIKMTRNNKFGENVIQHSVSENVK